MKTVSLFCVSVIVATSLIAADAQRTNPKVIESPSPGYPEELTDTGVSGVAEVDVTVKADGSVADPELAMATHRAFGRAAKAAIARWKFEPGQVDGAPAEMKVSIPFRFTAPLDQQVNAAAKRKAFATLPEPALSQKEYGAKLKIKREAHPTYPRNLAGGGGDQTVQVSFVVAPDGTTLNPTVVGNPPKDFVLPALQAVALMTYDPPVKGGKPVYVETTTKLEFANERRGFGGDGGFGGGGGGRGGGHGGGGGGGGGGGSGRGGGGL